MSGDAITTRPTPYHDVRLGSRRPPPPKLPRRPLAIIPPPKFGRAAYPRLNIGLFIPTSGAAGIWGPSCRACATLAAKEINDRGGVFGHEISLRIEDAGGDPDEIADRAGWLAHEGRIDAIVGMHISAVRESLVRTVGSRLPYVYTPLYEGGERTPGVYAIGETPGDQLLPALDWLCRRHRLRRWVLLGNDYVWPRTTHALAKRHFSGGETTVVGEHYHTLGDEDFGAVIDWIAALQPDAVLVSLVGQDSVNFNRAFGRAGLAAKILRFSCAIEENMLLGIGEANTERLFAAAGYFANIPTRDNGAFRERYYSLYGDAAPTLNSLGQSLYEGVHFLSALMHETVGRDWRSTDRSIRYGGARNAVYGRGNRNTAPVYLAEARGNQFEIITRLTGR